MAKAKTERKRITPKTTTQPATDAQISEAPKNVVAGSEMVPRGGIVPTVQGAFPMSSSLKALLEGTFAAHVGRVPTLESRATAERDPRRIRMILIVLRDKDAAPVGGVPLQLRVGGKLVDQATSDRRGLALLRFAADYASPGLPVTGAVRMMAEAPKDVTVPRDVGHVVHEMTVPPSVLDALPRATPAGLSAAMGALEASAEAVESLAKSVGAPLAGASGDLAKLVQKLAASSSADSATKLLATLGATIEAATLAIAAATEAAAQGEETRKAVQETLATIDRALKAVAKAMDDLARAVPDDSVLPRLPVATTTALAEDVTRLTGDRHGPDNCLPPEVCTSRGPVIKWVTLYRTRMDPQRKVHRLLVRVRQEWHFQGYTMGELKRVDARDPGTVNATLDAAMRASLAASGRLDAATASHLQVAAEAQLGLRSTIDSVLDVVSRVKLDGKLRAGIRDDPEAFSGDRWAKEPGTALGDWLLPDLGVDLDATLDASAHAELSVHTSLLVSAKLNAAATLTNQLNAAAALRAHGSLSLQASASANLNPSLSRAMNLFRFLVYENYLVTSHVEDVQAVTRLDVFEKRKQTGEILPLLFPPSDILEYRPIFQHRLLEPRLAPRFDTLHNAVAQRSGDGPVVTRLELLVDYAAASVSGARLDVRVGTDLVAVDLLPGKTMAHASLDLQTPTPVSKLPGMQLSLTTVNAPPIDTGFNEYAVPAEAMGAQVREVRVTSSASPDPRTLAFQGTDVFKVDGKSRSATRSALLGLPRPSPVVDADPLVAHVNRNETYYMGLLVEAALRRPSLRYDAPQLQSTPPDHPVWSLPLLGFEGTKALVLGNAPDAMAKVIYEDEGTATLVQLAAAGLYTEAVQGKFVLDDAAGFLHPALGAPNLPTLSMAPMSNAALLQALAAMMPGGLLAEAAAHAPSAAGAATGALAGVAGAAAH